MKFQHEWRIQVPWGQLALVSRGHPDGEPVLLVHGRQDSSSVFTPIINMMTDQYYYVALDMPGNGLSDAFPKASQETEGPDHIRYAVYFDTPPKPSEPFLDFCRARTLTFENLRTRHHGPKLMRFHFLYAMELALAHLGWDKFIFIGHSMGCEQGLFYNAIYPNRITKMILLDAGPTLMRMQVDDPAEFQRLYYDSYYDNYHYENFERKLYTRNTATEALKRLRDLNDPQCAALLRRNFHAIDDRCWNQIEEYHSAEMSREEERTRPQDGASSSNDGRNPSEARSQNESPVLELDSNSDDGHNLRCMRNPGPPLSTSQLVQQYMRRYQLRFSGELGSLDGENPERIRITREVPKDTTPNEAPALDLSQIIKHMRDHDAIGYLSWDNRLKNLAPQTYGNDYYFELFKTIPPALFVVASDGAKSGPKNPKWRQGAMELIDRLSKLDNFYRVDVEGSHDVHFTHPERVVSHIIQFLQDNKVSSKL